ncbi:alpha/beta hydrolase [Humibacillus sp. DSM 29435]|uniref:alpha/beta hydrolase n=1 Tax=Humibacillus sp. DSM 29435 TaxID=1869167 RepID=UPI0011131063|nr:alpha/beta hydrolase [Humibacillus sp. DSM 29435]
MLFPRRLAEVTLVAIVAAVTFTSPASAVSTVQSLGDASTSGLRVGSVSLQPCMLQTQRAAWCGSVQVPLDRTDPSAGEIRIGFGWVPSQGRPQGTLVAQEGGPGYPSTGTAPSYEAMAGSLLRHRNLLVVDARGTGRSTPLNCAPLQQLPSPSDQFPDAAKRCGEQLNHTFRRTDGAFVQASDLFGTANVASDIADVVGKLGLGRVDFYGDSYGTYVAQSFLARYPEMLRSVVMDSAYEARGLDPWYTTSVTTARKAFDTVCRRTAGCPPGSSWARVGRLAAALRHHPVTGWTVGTDARRHHVSVDVTALVNIVNDAGYDTDPYRQLDAAARAYLERHDGQPLLRLYAQDVGYDYSDYVGTRASYYSDGLYLAVACTDYPQLFSMHASPDERRAQLAKAVAAEPAATFAPFSVREWLSVLPYTETYTGCLDWPRPTHTADPAVPPGPFNPRHVPVLVLNGELDSLTPAAGGAHISRQLGPSARAYVAANNVHLVALDNAYPCGASVLQAFVTKPDGALDASCLSRIPAIDAVPAYPSSLASVQPLPGDGPLWLRRLAAMALLEGKDALVRWDYVDGNRDLGLRGGTVRYSDSGAATLNAVRFTRDTTVSGHVQRVGTAGGSGTVRVTGGGRSVTMTVLWNAAGAVSFHTAS